MKKHMALWCILLDVLALGLIPLNLFLLSLPEWVTAAAALLILAVSVCMWVKGRNKRAAKIAVSVVSLLSVCIVLFAGFCNPYWNSIFLRRNSESISEDYSRVLSVRDAKQDLDYAMKYLKKLHPALAGGLTPELETGYNEAVSRIEQSGGITVNALCRELEGVFSILGDAHTRAAGIYQDEHYLKYIHSHSEAGDVVAAVNGKTPKELLSENPRLYSYEAESYGLMRLENSLTSLEGLDYLGISAENGVVYTFEDTDGQREDFTFYPEDFLTYDEYAAYNGIEDGADEPESFVSFELQPERSLAVLTLTSCVYNSEYTNCLREMFTQVKEQGIENVCVDLRDNGGGNSMVANEFIRYLDIDSYRSFGMIWRLGPFMLSFDGGELENERYKELTFKGNVYLLTSTYTFSSAMDFTELIIDNGLGTVIGEPPGNDPNGYGDISAFTLPNSKLYIQISTKKWSRVDGTKSETLIQPDIECPDSRAFEELCKILDK